MTGAPRPTRDTTLTRLLATLLAALFLAAFDPAPARADGDDPPAARPAKTAPKRAKVARARDCAFPRYSIGAYCRYQASIGGRGEPPASIICAQDEEDVQRDLAARWCALPAFARRTCAARARGVVDRSYRVLNGCVDEARESGGLPGLIPGRGLFR